MSINGAHTVEGHEERPPFKMPSLLAMHWERKLKRAIFSKSLFEWIWVREEMRIRFLYSRLEGGGA